MAHELRTGAGLSGGEGVVQQEQRTQHQSRPISTTSNSNSASTSSDSQQINSCCKQQTAAAPPTPTEPGGGSEPEQLHRNPRKSLKTTTVIIIYNEARPIAPEVHHRASCTSPGTTPLPAPCLSSSVFLRVCLSPTPAFRFSCSLSICLRSRASETRKFNQVPGVS